MDKLQKLQADYRAKKITKAEYDAKLKKLLEDEDITQAEHDEAADFDPADPDDAPRYSQKEVDRIVLQKARREIKKALKAAGIELDPAAVNDKNLFEHVAQLALAGQGKLPAESEIAKQLKEAQQKLAKAGGAAADYQRLVLENAVLKTAGKYKPLNPAQVVRALGDYADLIEYDDEGKPDAKSVDRAIKKIATAEPNLFEAQEDEDGEGTHSKGNDDRGNFRGKGPNGGTPPTSKKQQELDAKKAKGLELMGVKKPDQKQ